jgi:hypothetical protein
MNADKRAGQKSVRGGAVVTDPSAPVSTSAFRNKQHKKKILKSVPLFYAIACGFAWLAWMPLVLGPAGLKLHKYPISLPVSTCVGTLGPLLGCFITHRVQTGNWRAVRLLPRNRLQMIWLYCRSASRASLSLSSVSRIHFQGRSESMALACRRSGRAMDTDVQLQPARRPSL